MERGSLYGFETATLVNDCHVSIIKLMEYCPHCKKVTNMRTSVSGIANDPARMVVTVSYHCEVCNMFVRSERVFKDSALNNEQAQAVTNQTKSELGKLAMNLFDCWELSVDEKLILLGLSPNSRNVLAAYRKGQTAPGKKDTVSRIILLLSIFKSLKILFPYNEGIRNSWIKRKNGYFNDKRPLDVAMDKGMDGLMLVDGHLAGLIQR